MNVSLHFPISRLLPDKSYQTDTSAAVRSSSLRRPNDKTPTASVAQHPLKPIHHTAEIFDSPGAVGVAAPTVQTNFTDFKYVARVNQTATTAQARSMSRAPNSLAHTGSRIWPMSWPMPE